MKIFSPHRRKMDASRRYGSREFQNKIKKAQGYKRVFDPRLGGVLANFLKRTKLNNKPIRVLLYLLIIVILYFVYISPYFLVKKVIVSGNQQVGTDQILSAIQDSPGRNFILIPKNHLFILSNKQATKLISTDQPLVKEINNFKRVWPNSVEIEVVERQPGFAFDVSGQWYLVDSEGLIVKTLADNQGLPIVRNQVNEQVEVGERLNNTKLVAFVLSLSKQWSTKVNSQIKEVRVPGKAAGQVQVLSSEGWEVFFDTTRSVESQVASLALILSRQIPAKDRLRLAYVDLRFDKWAYYCYKDSPCQAQPQGGEPPEGTDKTEVKE